MLLTRGVCRWFVGFYLVLIVMAHGSAWAQNDDASPPARVPPTRRLTPAEVPGYVEGVVIELQRLTAELRAAESPDSLRFNGYREVDPGSRQAAVARAAALRAQGQSLLTEMVYMLATVQDRHFIESNTHSATLVSMNLWSIFSSIAITVADYIGGGALEGHSPSSFLISGLMIYMITGVLNIPLAHPVQRLKGKRYARLPSDISANLKNDRDATRAFMLAQKALTDAGVDLAAFGFNADPHVVARLLTVGRNWASGPYKKVRSLCAHLLEPRLEQAEQVEVEPAEVEPAAGELPNLTGVRIAPESMEPTAESTASSPISADELPAANAPTNTTNTAGRRYND